MLNPFHQQTTTEKIGTALGITPQHKPSKYAKFFSIIMHTLLYVSIFLSGYIVAKVQTLVNSL